MENKKKCSFFFISILICLVACSQQNFDKKRRETLVNVITCFNKHDTVELFKIIDTSFMINLLSKEGFNGLVKGIQEVFTNNNVEVSERSFQEVTTVPNNTDYKAKFDLENGKYKSISFIFSFTQANTNSIYDISISLESSKIQDDTLFKSR